MADNVIVAVVGGTDTLQAKDNTTFKTVKHAIVREDGTNPLKVVVEDAAHSSGDTGILAMVVRADAAACTATSDGDNCALVVDANGKLWANAQISAVIPGTGATNLGKAEDAAHTTGDVGVMMLGVRNATATDLSAGNTDGDYEPLQVDANGCLHVIAKLAATQTLATVTNVATIGTSVTPGTAAANLGKAEDAAHSSADVGVMMLAVRQATATDMSAGNTDGDYEPIQVDASGRVHCNVGALVPGTGATALGKAEDAAHTTGDTGVFILGVANSTHTTAFAADGDYTPIGVDITGKVGIRGTFAEDAAATSGDLGVQILTKRTDVSAVSSGTDGDYSTLNVDEAGKVWTHETVDVSLGVTGAAVSSADMSGGATAVTGAPTSTKKLVVTDVVLSTDTTLAFTFTEETSGTVLFKLRILANTSFHFKPHGKLKLATADKKLMCQTSASGNVTITALVRSET